MLVAFIFIAIALFLLWQSGNIQQQASGCNVNTSCVITNDPSTWPSGDKIWNICQAIAKAEGANVAGSVPDRLNNPGDISDGLAEFSGEWHSGSDVTVFPDKATGWQRLYQKFADIAAGKSLVYFPTDSWSAIAFKYAGNSSAWLNNVTSILRVDPNSTIQDYINS